MTIVRPSSKPGFYGDETGQRRWWSGTAWGAESDVDVVPTSMRRERLEAQIASFERAGYRLETRSESQAVVVKARAPRPLRTAALAVVTLGLSLVLGARGPLHRVVITVDGAGAVRFA